MAARGPEKSIPMFVAYAWRAQSGPALSVTFLLGLILSGCATPGLSRSLTTFESTCGATVGPFAEAYGFPSLPCFYRSSVQVPDDYSITLEARSLDGDGYGIWVGSWHNGVPEAIAVQYLPAPYGREPGGIEFHRYPATEIRIGDRIPNQPDREWHKWELVGGPSSIAFYLDGVRIQSFSGANPGDSFGFRTWRGNLEVRAIHVQSARLDAPTTGGEQAAKLPPRRRYPGMVM